MEARKSNSIKKQKKVSKKISVKIPEVQKMDLSESLQQRTSYQLENYRSFFEHLLSGDSKIDGELA